MKKIYLTLFLSLISLCVFSQNRRFRAKQKIPLKYWVTDSYTFSKGDTLKLDSGSTVTTEKEVVQNGGKLMYKSIDTLSKDTLFHFSKKTEYYRKLRGNANAYVESDDYSKIYLDYWLTPSTYFPKNSILTFVQDGRITKIDTLKSRRLLPYYTVEGNMQNKMKDYAKRLDTLSNEIDSLSAMLDDEYSQVDFQEAKNKNKKAQEAGASDKEFQAFLKKLKEDKEAEVKNLYQNNTVEKYLWSAYAKEKILILKNDKKDTITYFKKYPEKSYIKLENRQYIKLRFSAWEVSALTIPFKYRFRTSKGNLTAPAEVSADFNVSTFIARTAGNLTYRNQSYEKVKPEGSAFSAGVFFGLSASQIDSTSTSLLGAEAFSDSRSVISFSPGAGAVYNYLNFNVGLFIGWDIGLGNTAQKWNYSNKPWFGFGIGYNLAMLKRKED
jgi:hypothetical protein